MVNLLISNLGKKEDQPVFSVGSISFVHCSRRDQKSFEVCHVQKHVVSMGVLKISFHTLNASFQAEKQLRQFLYALICQLVNAVFFSSDRERVIFLFAKGNAIEKRCVCGKRRNAYKSNGVAILPSFHCDILLS